MAPPLLVLALDFHQAPLRFRHLSDPRRPLPELFGDWLTESSAALGPARVQATAEALGTTPENLREAYRFLLRQILMVPQADHYRVLGLSRRCGSESVKQHRSLLIGLFHPDHLPEHDERSVSITVRINAAYQVLRDPQARRRYDSRLPPAPAAGVDDPDGFFRPRGQVAAVSGRTGTRAARPVRGRSLLLWALLCVVLMAVLYLVMREPRQPLLRLNPDLAAQATAEPSSPHGGDGPSATMETPGQLGGAASPLANRETPPTVHRVAKAEALDRPEATEPQRLAGGRDTRVQLPRLAEVSGDEVVGRSTPAKARVAAQEKSPPPVAREPVAAVRLRPSHSPGPAEGSEGAKPAREIRERYREPSRQDADREPGGEPNPTRAVSARIRRLEGSFARGDLAGLVILFTANVVVNDRVGAAAVRHVYADIVGQSGQGRTTLSGLRWRTGQHDLLLGRGAIRLGTRGGSQQAWSNLDGTVEIELVPWMGDYRISKLIHHLPRK